MSEFKFNDRDLITPKPVEGETYRQTFERLQQKRDLIVAKHFLDFGKRYPGTDIDDELIADIIGRMEF